MITPSQSTILDLHIHSRFSRACSKELLLPNIAVAAAEKGISLVGTGDFTHPGWFAMMERELVQTGDGFYRCPSAKTMRPVFFVPTVEVACIYKKNGAVRRIHLLIVAPDFTTVKKINTALGTIGNLNADGRPMLGLDAKRLLEIVLAASERCVLIPAHAWTPWFSVFGSKSGFDSLAECFEELTPYVQTIETGLSSDPPMNRRISSLDEVTLISNSDAHSLDNLGREATVLVKKTWSYDTLRRVITGQDSKNFAGTIEFYPQAGKYHVDGHAACGVRLMPKETKSLNGMCPICSRPVTVGVLSRIETLADRPAVVSSKIRPPFVSSVPLREILAEVLGVGKKTKKVAALYQQLVPRLGTEFEVLIETPIAELRAASGPAVAGAIQQVRQGNLVIEPGYDGVFGSVRLYEPEPL